MSFDPEQSEQNPPSHAAPPPVLSLEYEPFDSKGATAQRRYRVGLLLIAMALIASAVVFPTMALFARFWPRGRHLQAAFAVSFLCDVSIFAGSWIVLGFDRSGRRRTTTIGIVGRVLLTIVLSTQIVVMISQVLPSGLYSFGVRAFTISYWSEAAWVGINVPVMLYVAIRLHGSGPGRWVRPLLGAAGLRGIFGIASSVLGYIFIKLLVRGGSGAPNSLMYCWQICGLVSLAAMLANGIVLLLIARELRRRNSNN